MTPLTSAQVLDLAPDGASAAAAKGLMKPAKWVSLGAFDGGLWGQCQGSGSKPYQVMVDANGLGCKCSCPSRKFPCKHGLALMLMFAEGTGKFDVDPTPWMLEWLQGRQDRAEKQTAKKEAAAAAPPADPVKQAKKQEVRLEKMRAGAQFLGLWMRDLLREGIADLRSRKAGFWQETAARMVDAQAPGLARRVEEISSLLYRGNNWPEHVLAAMGRLQLLLDALENYESLPPDMQADVRVGLGWAQDKQDVVQSEAVEDVWSVVGLAYEANGPLHERRVWLHGSKSGRYALLLDFAHGGRKFEQSFLLGSKCNGKLGYFPSAAPSRALVIPPLDAAAVPGEMPPGMLSMAEALSAISEQWATHPLAMRQPVAFARVTLQFQKDGWAFLDAGGSVVPTRFAEARAWLLAATTGGLPFTVFGEWNGLFTPLSALFNDEWINLKE